MNIELTAGEHVLRNLKGKSFETNPIARIIKKFAKLLGKTTDVKVALTNKRIHIAEESKFLWVFVTERHRKVMALENIDLIHAMQTSTLLVFKSHNIIFYNGGVPWTAINLKGSSYANLESEINGFSLVKTLRDDEGVK